MTDCIEHLYSWDSTLEDSYRCPGCAERERIVKLLKERLGNGDKTWSPVFVINLIEGK